MRKYSCGTLSFWFATRALGRTKCVNCGAGRQRSWRLARMVACRRRALARTAVPADEKGWFRPTPDVRNQQARAPRLENVDAVDLYPEPARSLNQRKFAACRASTDYKTAAEADRTAANALGITGTPRFLVGTVSNGAFTGERVTGAQPLSAFDAKIEPLLAPKP